MAKTKNKIETLINKYVNSAIKGKQAYYEGLQTAFEIFVAHYNNELGKNSSPLFNILKASGKDILTFKKYIYASTNITHLALSEKGGLKLTFDGEFTYNDSFIDTNKWYDELKKADKKGLKMLDDISFNKIVKGLLKRLDNSDKVTNKDKKVKALNSLLTA